MDKVFRTKQGAIVEDVFAYTRNQISEQRMRGQEVTIYIGTDSQDKGGKTTYATCICYRYGNRGVHYIYTKENFPRLRDDWSRLYKETEHTMEVATWFVEMFPKLDVTLDLDYNIDPSTKSNALVSATRGWAESMGMKVNIKLNWEDDTTKYQVQVATKAADRECRGGGSKAKNRKMNRKAKRTNKTTLVKR
tara:strand:+ start:671 stop:1246 length:576 start_codon:yes stop_codon:yes gene_type:complete